MSHNHLVRRFLAACLLAVFAFLATADTFACPDGCDCDSPHAAAARCDTGGVCVFCAAAALISVRHLAVVRLVAADVIAAPPVLDGPLPPAASLDHPPRLS